MPDVNKPDREASGKRQFIYEKIVKPPVSRRQRVARALLLLVAAAAFGVVAAATFVVSRPLAERYLGNAQTETDVTVSYPQDELDTSAAFPPGESETEPAAAETEPIEDLLQSALEDYEFSLEDLLAMNGRLWDVCREADKGIVTVHSVKRQMDWFDNPVENTGLYAGAIIANTGDELLILTPIDAVEAVDSIKVTFSEGSEAPGQIKQTDTVSDLAVVSVQAADVSEEAIGSVVSLPLGNSYSIKQGDLIAAVGGPAGAVHSSALGRVTYIGKGVQVTDGATRLLYTDMTGILATGTFLVDMTGSIVGWVTDDFQNGEKPGAAMAMGISDYKWMLEKMSNGLAVPYLGIQGQDVTDAVAEETSMPSGLYVSAVVQDSPAYQAGIQNGDIITHIGDRKIAGMKEYRGALEKISSGSVVTVTVQRNGRDEYKAIEYQVTVGAR